MNCKEALRLIIKKGWLKEICLNDYGYTKAKTKEIAKLVSFLTEFNNGHTTTPYCNCEEALKLIINNNLFKGIVVTTTDSLEDTELTNFIKEFKQTLENNVKFNSIKFASSKPINYTVDTESYEIKKDNFGFSSVKGRTIPKIRHINVGEKKGKKLVCVVFEDGSHIIKECHSEDEFDINVGVALCLVEKYYSTTNQFHKLIKRKLTEKSKETLESWKKANKKDPEW